MQVQARGPALCERACAEGAGVDWQHAHASHEHPNSLADRVRDLLLLLLCECAHAGGVRVDWQHTHASHKHPNSLADGVNDLLLLLAQQEPKLAVFRAARGHGEPRICYAQHLV